MAFTFLKSLVQRFTGRPVDWDELEELLIRSDLGVPMSMRILKKLQESPENRTAEKVVEIAREEIVKILPRDTHMLRPLPNRPKVILVVGVNGTGKTTSTAKLAHLLKRKGHSVMLAAADTFRAAAIEQLQLHGERQKVRVVAQAHGSDPGAVLFDALTSAHARGEKVILADTAGRMHNKANLVKELQKLDKIAMAKVNGGIYQKILVLDATTGQNAFQQAKVFHEAVGVDGIILSKYDSSGRGGIAVAISSELGLPFMFFGTGEKPADFAPFDIEQFLEGLLGSE